MTLSSSHDMLRKVDATLSQRFEDIAAACPRRPAVHADASTCSYDALNRLANRLAHALIARGATPGCRIALLTSRGLPQIAAMIAALKAGGIVVALNATDSAERLREIVADAEPMLLVTDKEHRSRAAEIGGNGCVLVSFEEGSETGRDDNPGLAVAPDDAALLIYTSGSTGRPRGVMRSHRHALHNAFTHVGVWGLTHEDRVALLMPLSGGNGTTIAWAALVTGAALEPFDVLQESVIGFADKLVAGRTTVLCATASFFRSFIKTLPDAVRFPDLRVLRLGTEAVVSSDFEAFKRLCPPTSRFVQTFGSSETGNVAQLVLGHDDIVPMGRLPAGNILDDIEVRLLDEDGRDVARGDAGRIVVRSPYLAAGYWRDAALTAARFSEEGGVRVFRSGDLGRINSAGQLELIGRSDDIVKIRGYRVALSEVEGAVLSLPEVSSAAVVATREETPWLVAYVVAQQGQSLLPVDLRRRLRTMLSPFMMPSRFVMMDALPLGQTGKIDRVALAAMNPGDDRAIADAPATDTEIALAAMWADALKLPSVGRNENFFDLGGDSLAAAVIGAQVQSAFDVDLSLQSFYDYPVLADFALHVEEIAESGVNEISELVAVPRTGPLSLSPFQERVWHYSQTSEHAASYVQRRLYRISGLLNSELLRDCMRALADRHEALRSYVETRDGQPTLAILPAAADNLDYVDMSGASDPEAAAKELIAASEERQPIDLSRPPLYRMMLFKIGAQKHLLFRRAHHIICDADSWRIYMRELSEIYQARARGDVPALSPLPIQYADYAAWHRSWMRPGLPLYRRSIDWWEKALRDVTPLDLGHLDAAIGVAHPRDCAFKRDLPAAVNSALRDLAAQTRATPFAVVQAALAVFLSIETGSRDVVTGTNAIVRNRPALQNLFGPFMNLVALRLSLPAETSFRAWIRTASRQIAAAASHGDVPYEDIYRELARVAQALPEIKVIALVRAREEMTFGDLTISDVGLRQTSIPWGMSLIFDRDYIFLSFDGTRYDPAAVHRFSDRLLSTLATLVSQPDAPIENLPSEATKPRRPKRSLPRRIASRIKRRFGVT